MMLSTLDKSKNSYILEIVKHKIGRLEMKIKGDQAQTLTVRLPENLVAELKKLKLEQELPTISSAIKYWAEQQHNEQIEGKLNELEAAIRETSQVIQLNQANIILNSNMIAVILKAIGPEKITDNLEAQKGIEDTIKYIENNQATINSFIEAGLDQGKKLQKKHPVKQEKTEDERINS